MESMGKHEYMDGMNVKTLKFFFLTIWKKEGFHIHGQKKKKNDRPTDPDFFFLRYGKQTIFFMPKLFFTPVCAQWGPLGPNHFQVLPRRNFGTKVAPYLYTPKITINQKNKTKNVPCQNGGQKKKCLVKMIT